MCLKRLRKPLKGIVIFLIFCIVSYFILGYMGLIYMKNDEAKKMYEFTEDINADEKKENIRFVNKYYSYSKRNTCDSEYTSNHIKIYLNGKEIYSDEFSTLGPLLNPQIVDSVEKNNTKKQIYVHENGGGPVMPMDYFFEIRNGKVVVNEMRSDY